MLFTPKIGRAYERLPAHHSFAQLADNIERLANDLMYQSLGRFSHKNYQDAPNRWEWKLGKDLKLLVEYAKGYVPPDIDGLHHFDGRGRKSSTQPRGQI